MARREYLVRMDARPLSKVVRYVFGGMIALIASVLIVGELVVMGIFDKNPVLVAIGVGLLGLLGVLVANLRYAATAVLSERGITILGFGSKPHLPWTEIERVGHGNIGGADRRIRGFLVYPRGQEKPWTFGNTNTHVDVLEKAATLAASGRPEASAELIRKLGIRRGPAGVRYQPPQIVVATLAVAVFIPFAWGERSDRAAREFDYRSDEPATTERLQEILNDRWLKSGVRCDAGTSLIRRHDSDRSFDAAIEACRMRDEIGCSPYDRCEEIPHRAAVQEALATGDGATALGILKEHLPKDQRNLPFWFDALNAAGTRAELVELARRCVGRADRLADEPREQCVEELWRQIGLEAEPLEDAHPESAPAHVVEHGPVVVAFPEAFPSPERESHIESSGGLDVEVMMFSTYSEEHDAKVIVAHNEYPDDLPGPVSSEDLVEASAQNMLDALGGEILREEAATIHGRPARQFLALRERDGEAIYVRLQLRAAAPHVVSIMYLSPKRSELSAPPANQLFDSLRLP